MPLATVMQWMLDSIPLVVNEFSGRVGLGFGVSLLSIGSGIIIGLRISASMLIGGIVAWVLMPPWLVSQGLLAPDGRRVDVLLLVMWPSVGLVLAGGLCALLLRWRVLAATFRSLAAADVTWTLGRGGPTVREPQAPARFKVGDRVRAREMHPATHTRLPRYVRGHVGEIERIHGCHVFPDAHAQGLGEDPQWLYAVCFDGRQLWGADADPSVRVSVDAFEPYLEPT